MRVAGLSVLQAKVNVRTLEGVFGLLVQSPYLRAFYIRAPLCKAVWRSGLCYMREFSDKCAFVETGLANLSNPEPIRRVRFAGLTVLQAKVNVRVQISETQAPL